MPHLLYLLEELDRMVTARLPGLAPPAFGGTRAVAPAPESARLARLRPVAVVEACLNLVPGLCKHMEHHHGHLQSLVSRYRTHSGVPC
jgi:hypothetical protein